MKHANYNPNTSLGRLEPVVLYHTLKNGEAVGFHFSELEYAKLNGGCGTLVGRTPWGPFCRLKIFEWRIVGISIIRDKDELLRIKEELES